MMSIFLTFEALPGRFDILFNSLEEIPDSLTWKKGLLKCQDICVGLDMRCLGVNCHCMSVPGLLASVVKANSLLLLNVFNFVGICIAFGNPECLHLENVFSFLPTSKIPFSDVNDFGE